MKSGLSKTSRSTIINDLFYFYTDIKRGRNSKYAYDSKRFTLISQV